MATDATGTPTSLGIPKYDTSVDAPSGLGFNAAMDEIDTLIQERAKTPSGIASGEAMVWNGTTWVRSSVTKLDASTSLQANFSAYTPTLTASTTNPTLGSGSSATGRYVQIGKLVHCYGTIQFGSSGTAAGSGTYRISLPVNHKATVSAARLGMAQVYDGGANVANVICTLDGTVATYFTMSYPATFPSGTATAVAHNAPFAWGANMVLGWTITYEAA